MLAWIQSHILSLALSAIPVGAISFLLVQWIKRGTTWIDGLSPTIKRGVVFVIAAALTALGAVLGVPIVCDAGQNCLASLDQNTVQLLLKAALGAVTAFLLHLGKNSTPTPK
jgi:hypothetical protein